MPVLALSQWLAQGTPHYSTSKLGVNECFWTWGGGFFYLAWDFVSVLLGFLYPADIFFYILMFPLGVADSNPEPLGKELFQYLTLSQDQHDLVMAVVSLIVSNPECSCQHSHLTRVILRNTKLTLNILM